MTDRRYDEDEVRRIFDAASRSLADSSGGSEPDEGLTLEDLKRIGGEVGLPPARIEEAARTLDHTPSGPRVERDLGMPVTVGRSVDLPRVPSETEWARIVAHVRDTFGARGSLDSVGQSWWNGNLNVGVEPTTTGHRLRIRTTKTNGRLLNRVGAGVLGFSGVAALLTLLVGEPDAAVAALGIGVYGVGALAINALRLPAWARRRADQMERVAEHAVAVLDESPGA